MKRVIFWGGLATYLLGLMLCCGFVYAQGKPAESFWGPKDDAQDQRMDTLDKNQDKLEAKLQDLDNKQNNSNLAIGRVEAELGTWKGFGILFGSGMMFLQAIQVLLWVKVKRNGGANPF